MNHIDNLLKLFVLLLPCKNSDLSMGTLRFAPLYRSGVTQIFLFARSTTSTTLWASLSCSSLSLDIVGISTGDKFSSVAKFSARRTSWFPNRINWLKSASPNVGFWTSRNSLLSSFLHNLSFTSNWLESFLNQENRTKMSCFLPKSTQLHYTVNKQH